jgi:hypothetical protein
MITGLGVTGTVYPHKYKGPPGKQEWKGGLDIRDISKTICLMALCLILNTELFWICGYADSFFVAKPMSQPWTTLWWLRTWLLVPLFPSGSTS